MDGSIRTLQGLLGQHEAVASVSTNHPSLADSVFNLNLRDSVTAEHRASEGLADSDEWEGLASSTKCPSSDSLVAVEKPDDVVDQHGQHQSKQQNEEGGNDAQNILLSVAAIGAAAFGVFVANRPQQSSTNDRNRSSTNTNDTDWVTVDRRSEH
jgi:hypothetical protein